MDNLNWCALFFIKFMTHDSGKRSTLEGYIIKNIKYPKCLILLKHKNNYEFDPSQKISDLQ